MCGSLFTYSMQVWSTSAKLEPQKLQIPQNKAIRSIFFFNIILSYSTNDIRKMHKIMSIKHMMDFNNTLFMYEIDHELIQN